MSHVSEVNRFLFDANNAFTIKNLPVKSDFKLAIKELTDPQRKKLLEIIKDPSIADDGDIAKLADAIQQTQAALKDGSFKTRRQAGLWKRICRALSNIFKGRTCSSDVMKCIKKMEQSPVSAKKLNEINKELEKLYTDPEALSDTDVIGLLSLQKASLKNSPNNLKIFNTYVFDHAGEVDLGPEVVDVGEIIGPNYVVSASSDIRADKTKMDGYDYLEMPSIGTGYALFNGVNGVKAKEYFMKVLLDEVQSTLEKVKDDLTDANIYNALTLAFNTCNKNWLISQDRLDSEDGALSGSSACVALMINDNLWIANVGKTRAILIDDTQVHALTTDASPYDPKYKAMVEANDGVVNDLGYVEGPEWNARDRVWTDSPGLGVAQALGCFNFTGVTAKPEIAKVAISDLKDNSKIILGSEGLFDIATNDEVGNYVRTCDPSEIISSKLTNRVTQGWADDPVNAPASAVIAISLKNGAA